MWSSMPTTKLFFKKMIYHQIFIINSFYDYGNEVSLRTVIQLSNYVQTLEFILKKPFNTQFKMWS